MDYEGVESIVFYVASLTFVLDAEMQGKLEFDYGRLPSLVGKAILRITASVSSRK